MMTGTTRTSAVVALLRLSRSGSMPPVRIAILARAAAVPVRVCLICHLARHYHPGWSRCVSTALRPSSCMATLVSRAPMGKGLTRKSSARGGDGSLYRLVGERGDRDDGGCGQ